jgi:hypothetical protein
MPKSNIDRDDILHQDILYCIRHWASAFYIPRHLFKRPILIFSTRRSGSTLLMEAIHSQKEMNYSDQPLDLGKYHPYRKYLPKRRFNKFISLEPEEEKILGDYFQRLFTGRIRVLSQWNFFRPGYSFTVDRMVVKILNGKPLIGWFAENFDVDIVYLLRHPIPTALSVMRRNWENTAEIFLSDDNFTERYLGKEKTNECHRILEYGTRLQKFVLEWGLENYVPLSNLVEPSRTTITYEELVARPAQICQLLATALDLSAPERMSQRLDRPSKTTLQHSRTDITRQGPMYLLTRWLDQVDPKQACEAMAILEDLFDTRTYIYNSPFPVENLCHFGSLP